MIIADNISHSYSKNKIYSEKVLHNISFNVSKNKFVLILGQSGSGKTTLLNIMAGLMKPSKGRVFFENYSIYDMTQSELCDYRRDNVGFIFQNYFLENSYTVYENVLVPLLLNKKMSDGERKKQIENVLNRVGLLNKLEKKPYELSGGECQRVSIARALVNDPKIIFADEPTGNLDSINGQCIIDLLKEQTQFGKTVFMVTHNESYVKYADIVLQISDGVLI